VETAITAAISDCLNMVWDSVGMAMLPCLHNPAPLVFVDCRGCKGM
jgi:hypothetical protein